VEVEKRVSPLRRPRVRGCFGRNDDLNERLKDGAAPIGLDGAEGSGGEEEDGGDQGEDAFDGDADQAEGEQDEPDDGIEDERGEGDGPADDEQDAE
jgi:hypothetical protein